MRFFKPIAIFFFWIYLVPSIAAAGMWSVSSHPANWRVADWSSSGRLPSPSDDPKARIAIFAARTGGFKGAFAVHSWIVVKAENATHYDRYDVVGWGQPVRKNAYAPDGRWYSNTPETVVQIDGKAASALIPKIEAAIASYPHNVKGAYVIWPGPNSNTFVATILADVPEIGGLLPPNAVGRDFPGHGDLIRYDADRSDLHLSLFGYAGISIGKTSGFELNLLGLVAGIDVVRPAIKIPAWGRFGMM